MTDTAKEGASAIPPTEISDESVAAILGHCPGASTVNYPSTLHDDAEQGTLEPKVPAKHDQAAFEYAEHRYLGDNLILPGNDSSPDGKEAKYNPLILENGIKVTYGEINGLAGDFFSTTKAISSGSNFNEQKIAFQKAFDQLAKDPNSKPMVDKLLGTLQKEVTVINDAVKNGESPSEAYKNKIPDVSFALDNISKKFKESGLTYLELAKKNTDHFGMTARIAYNAGHAVALDMAKNGDQASLLKAYALNSFSDHFLEDSFASGHFRVPRDKLLDGTLLNYAAKLMHDEDNRLGLFVRDPAKQREWVAYGDKRMLEKENATNLDQCFKALSQSVAEVHQAFQSKSVIPPTEFKAWNFAPSVESMTSSEKNPAPLLKVVNGELCRRKDTSKTVAQTSRDELSQKKAWDSYTPVSSSFLTYYVDWITFVYQMTPDGTLPDYVKSYVKSLPGIGWLLDKLGIV